MKIFNKQINLEGSTFIKQGRKIYLQSDKKTHYLFPDIINAYAFADYCQGKEEQVVETLCKIKAPAIFDSDYELCYFIMILDEWIDQSTKDQWEQLKQSGHEFTIG